MMNKKMPLVSIIIPVKPGGFVKALESVKLLDYPRDRMEILVAEGCQPSRQRNEAAKEASGKVLYFLDDDSCPHNYNLRSLVEHFSSSDVAVVGGPSITPDSDSFIQHCFSGIFTSLFGGGGVRNRYRKVGHTRNTTEKELILCNLAFRADLFKKMGGLNEKLYPNEENELMSRIKDEGLSLIHDPAIFVYRSQRKTLLEFVKQIFSYGRGRMEQTIISPSSFSLLHFIPLVFLLYVISLFVIFRLFYWIPLIFYAALTVFFSIKASLEDLKLSTGKLKYIIFLSSLFPVMHLTYGAGMFWGLKKLWSKAESVKLKIYIRKINLCGN